MGFFAQYQSPVSSSPPASIGVIGQPIPADADLVGFEDPSGNLAPGHVDGAGNILVSSGAADPGRAYVTSSDINYGTTPVTTGAWVQLIASMPAKANMVEVFDSSGEIMELGVGAAASETRVMLIFPGGNGQVPLSFAAGTRVSIRAVSASATTAGTYNLLNFYS